MQHARYVHDLVTQVEEFGTAGSAIPTIEPDQRARLRFPLALPLTYRSVSPEGRAGAGRTLNVSSGGVLFTAAPELSVGMTLELTIEWPVLLEGSVPLQMRLFGTTLRANADQVVLRIDKHEFRTTRR